MKLQVTNSLTRKKEIFTPIKEGEVKMYVCGPTVYNFIHVGNARPLVFFDVVRRYLEFCGFKVMYVSNFTDVDDKIINRAREEKVPSSVISERYTQEFLTDAESLKVRKPHQMPKVTGHIREIIALIEGLVKNGAAYVAADGEVFFSVRNFKGYGKLSGKNIDDLIAGARVDLNEKKNDPLDFSLWKPQKTADEPAWESPWGKGRPGWHIECSAMAMQYLGQTFDIHGGGMDLIHPHHENEIAQSEAFSHKPFVRYWMHNNMLTFQSEKMSKSLGNTFLTRDFVKKYGAETLRFLLLSGHYRSTIDFSEKQIRDSQSALHRFYTTLKKCQNLLKAKSGSETAPTKEETTLIEIGAQFAPKWQDAMNDDFNTAKLMGHVFEYIRALNAYLDRKGFKPNTNTYQIAQSFVDSVRVLSGVLNVFAEESSVFLNELRMLVLKERGVEEKEILQAIRARAEARARKDFATSDKMRAELLEKGIELKDLAHETEWDVILA